MGDGQSLPTAFERVRFGHGVGLVKSIVRLEALPNAMWDPTVEGGVHAQKLCPGWISLSASGQPKKAFNAGALRRKLGPARSAKLSIKVWSVTLQLVLVTFRSLLAVAKFTLCSL